MNQRSLDIATELCKRFEGFSSKPYICPAGYWTIGYGTVYKPDGTVVTKDHPPITRELAEEWLISELKCNYMLGVLKLSPNLVKHPEILGALADFAYNLGVSRYKISTLRKRVNEENWEEAKFELKKWVRGGGKILRGLVIRREAESKYL